MSKKSPIISVKILSDAKNFAKGFDEATKVADSFGSKVGNKVTGAVGKVGSALVGTAKYAAAAGGAMAAAFGGTALAKGFQRLQGLEEANKMLDQMGLSTGEVEAQMAGLNEVLTGTPYALNDGAQSLAGLVAAGVPLKDTERMLSRVADAAAFGQAPLGEMSTIFERISLNGRVSTQELNQLADRGIPIFAMLAEAMEVPQDELRKMVSAGELSAEQFNEAWDKAAKGFGENGIVIEGAAKSAGDTLRGSWGNAMAAMGRLGATVLGPIYERLPGIIQAVTGKISELAKAIGPMVEAFFESEKVKGFLDGIQTSIENINVTALVERVQRGIQSITELFQGDLAGAGVSIGKMFGFEEDSIPTGKIITAFETIKKAFEGDGKKIGNFFSSIGETIGKLIDPISKIATSLAKASASTGVSVWKVFLSVLPTIARILDVALVPAFELIATLMEQNQGIVTGLVLAFTGFKIAKGIITGISAVTKVWTGIQAAFNAVMAANPIVLVVLAIAALVAGLVLAYQKVDWFRDAVDAVWGFLKDNVVPIFQTVVSWVGDKLSKALQVVSDFWTKILWPALKKVADFIINNVVPVIRRIISTFIDVQTKVWEIIGKIVGFVTGIPGRISGTISTLWDGIKTGITGAYNWVKEQFTKIVNHVTGLPGRIASAASGMWNGIKTAFKSAINWIIDGWNGMEFKIPGFKIGPVGYDGFTLGLPKIPKLHTGGVVNAYGPDETLRVLQHGEVVLPAGAGVAGGGTVIHVHVAGSVISERDLLKSIQNGLAKETKLFGNRAAVA